jgi:hypothetical protein
VPSGGALSGFLALGGGLGATLVAAVVVARWEELLPWGLGVLGAQFAGSLYVPGGASAGAAPLYAAGLLLVGELTAWSLASRTRLREERPVVLVRLAFVGGAAVVAALAGVVLVALASEPTRGGFAWVLVGTAAAVGAIALVVRAVRA